MPVAPVYVPGLKFVLVYTLHLAVCLAVHF